MTTLTTLTAPPRTGFAADPRLSTRIGLPLGFAAALVGLNRPAVGSITPTVALVVAAFLLTVTSRSTRPSRITTLEFVLMLGVAVRIVMEFVDTQTARTPFGTGMLADAAMILLTLYVVRTVFTTVRDVVVLAWCVVVPASMVAALALAQMADVPGVNAVLVQLMRGSGLQARLDNGWEVRATSTIGHWTALGGYLSATIAIGCALLIHLARQRKHGRHGRSTRLLTALLAVMIGGQVATFTFATIGVTAAVLVATVVIVRPRAGTFAAGVVTLLALWVAVSDVFLQRIAKQQSSSTYGTSNGVLPESIQYRVTIWERETIPAALDNLLTGHGSLVYRYIGTGIGPRSLAWGSPESEWFRTLVSFGAVALMLEVAAVGLAISVLVRMSTRSAFLPIAVMAIAMTVAMTIHSHLYDRAFSLVFWSVAVVATTLERSRQSNPAAQKEFS